MESPLEEWEVIIYLHICLTGFRKKQGQTKTDPRMIILKFPSSDLKFMDGDEL